MKNQRTDKRVERILTWWMIMTICIIGAVVALSTWYDFGSIIPVGVCIVAAMYSAWKSLWYMDRVDKVIKQSTEWQYKTNGVNVYEDDGIEY